MSKKKIIWSLGALLAVGVAGRLLPHAANMTPIVAIALFTSAYFGVRYSLPVVVVSMVISDMFIGFYDLPILAAVYGSFIIAGLLGAYLRVHKSAPALLGFAASSSLIFFIVTNWAVWQFGTMYTHSFSGLIQAYSMAIPFFRNSLIGDISYTMAFFAVPYIVSHLSSRCTQYKQKTLQLSNPIKTA